MNGVIFIIFLGALAYLALWYFIAAEFQKIAVMKGQKTTRYFWWTFFLGPVGMLMVVALPVVTASAETVVSDELPEHCKTWERKEWLLKLAIPEHALGWTFLVCPIAGIVVAGLGTLIE